MKRLDFHLMTCLASSLIFQHMSFMGLHFTLQHSANHAPSFLCLVIKLSTCDSRVASL